MNKTKMLIIQITVFYFILLRCSTALKQGSMVDKVNMVNNIYSQAFLEEPNSDLKAIMSRIVLEALDTEMVGYRCVLWIQDEDMEWSPRVDLFSKRLAVMTMNINVESSYYGENSTLEFLLESWSHLCRGIILSSSFAEYFLDLWEEVRMISNHRNYPRLLVLPSKFGEYAEKIYSMTQANYIADILAVQIINEDGYDGDNKTNHSVHIVTNNFSIDPRLDNSSSVMPIAVYNESNLQEIDLFPDKLKDLQGKQLVLANLDYPPYGILDPFDGMEVRLVQFFCKLHNCTLIPLFDEYAWGDIYPNKTGEGILGNVFTDKADFGNGAIYLWPNQYPYLDYSSPYSITKVTCMVPKPLLYPEWQIPLHPFSGMMWAAQIIAIVVAAIILFFINKVAKKYDQEKEEAKATEFDSLSGNLLRSLGMSLLQPPSGGPIKPDSPMRSFFTMFEVLFLLFTTIYCGALESYLTVPVRYPPIDTIEELHNSGISWAADHEAWVYSIQGAPDPHIIGLLSRFEIHTSTELEKLGNEGKYGLTLEIMAAGHVTYQKHLSADMIFDHHVMREGLYFTSLITVLRKGGPYSEKFDEYLHRCLSGGLLNLWEEDVATIHLSPMIQTALEISQSTKVQHHSPKKLGIVQTQGAFIILAMGLVGAAASLLFEIYRDRQNAKVKKFKRDQIISP